MIIGQVLQVQVGTNQTYYGPWSSAEGNLAVVSCEVIQTAGLAGFEITVQTKNTEDSDKDQVSPAGGTSNSITLSTETLTKFNVGAKLSDTTNLGFKELYRYKYFVDGGESDPGGTGFVHFRMLNPAWLTH